MSINIKVALDSVWSISDRGAFHIDIVPKGNEKKVLGSFTFEQDMITEALEEDIEGKQDLTDWYNLKHYLDDLHTSITDMLENA